MASADRYPAGCGPGGRRFESGRSPSGPRRVRTGDTARRPCLAEVRIRSLSLRIAPRLRSVGAVREDVHDRAARLSKHEAANAPLLVAQGIGDLEAALRCPGVDRIYVIDLNRDAGCGGVVVA